VPDCETDIRQASHCGKCTTMCSGGTPVCAASGATYACASGCTGNLVRCSGICTDTTSDAANCNGCGMPCTIANGTPKCSASKCVPATCNTGYSICGAACTYTDGDPMNCGGCSLKCPTGSLCKSGVCEVRLGYPTRFTGSTPFQGTGGEVTASPISVAKQSTLLALGYINSSTTAGVLASLGLYNETVINGSKAPGSLVASAAGVVMKTSVQEVPVTNVVLVPGTYYFAILTNTDGEPMLFSSFNATPTLDFWVGGPATYESGLPPSYTSLASEVFPIPQYNIYLVVRQPGS
jgi:hypothetical protein